LKTRVPTGAAVAAVADAGLRGRLSALLTACPTEPVLAQAALANLEQADLQIAEVLLLWQNRDKPWGPALATASTGGATLEALYTQVDDEFWKYLGGQQFSISVASAVQMKALNVIEIALRLPAQVTEAEMLQHPLRVVWTVQENGDPARTVETDGLTLVQYFNAAASVSVSAILTYAGKELPVAAGKTVPIALTSPLSIAANPDYRIRKFCDRVFHRHGHERRVRLDVRVVRAVPGPVHLGGGSRDGRQRIQTAGDDRRGGRRPRRRSANETLSGAAGAL
jgi:hypothetical protein